LIIVNQARYKTQNLTAITLEDFLLGENEGTRSN
jgi:hypothetical protein